MRFVFQTRENSEAGTVSEIKRYGLFFMNHENTAGACSKSADYIIERILCIR